MHINTSMHACVHACMHHTYMHTHLSGYCRSPAFIEFRVCFHVCVCPNHIQRSICSLISLFLRCSLFLLLCSRLFFLLFRYVSLRSSGQVRISRIPVRDRTNYYCLCKLIACAKIKTPKQQSKEGAFRTKKPAIYR